MSKNGNYNYPGANESDRGILELHKEKWWNDTELAVFKKCIYPKIKDRKDKDLLIDVGAGTGRYINFFGNGFKKVIAIEPDQKRADKIRGSIYGFSNELQIINKKVSGVRLGEAGADVVLFVHIIQHICEEEAEEALQKISKWLKPGGLFVLAFPRLTKYYYEYNIFQHEGKKYVCKEVSREEFNKITTKDNLSVLPVKKYKAKDLANKISGLGLQLLAEENYITDFDKDKLLKYIAPSFKRLPISWQLVIPKWSKYQNYLDSVMVFKKL